MKLYKIKDSAKVVTITHSEKGVKYKRQKKRIEYVQKDILVENPESVISSSLNRGHLEDKIERIANYLAALTMGNKNEMARLLDTDYSYNETIFGYRFEE